MKKLTIILLGLLSFPVFSQVAVGKSAVTAGSNVSLEFYDSADNAKGIVVPWTSTVPDNPIAYNATTGAGYRGIQGTVVDGTIIFDLSDKKMKYMKAGAWSDLTGSPVFPLTIKDSSNNDVTFTEFNNINSTLQDNAKEVDNAKSAIGVNAATDTTTGILVLTDTDKAMVLPKVASPHLTIQNPAPGMMVFDTVKRQLAVYNGTVWSFWKP
ncbi:hypothetical protein IX39_19695 [Chryseobacterium formosense]|uniref:Uncharacterized protein n=1 Tax=Chryseobacterium formosense TaxID=236814 RepID=A0A085YZ93_9FLAO|nr:hypothetical protein [Chryseobacterium formosense]KFE97506.1 hypothetical protein IX39_19695 [Chryseobacterium formosense]SFT75506.1 hypothetical protein SAMN05421857_3053 [Chryseobacterium formosense]